MLTTLIGLLVAVGPGAILGFVVAPGRDRWIVWASAPTLTLGLTAAAMGWLPVLHLPDSAGAVLVAELSLALVGAGAVAVLRRRRPPPAGPRSSTRFRPGRRDWVALAIPGAAGLALGWAILARFSYPPGWDAMNHAILTRNIMASGSTAVTSACTTGSVLPEISCHFYPLAGDVTWAQTALLGNGHVSTAMTTWSAVLGPLALVVAVFTFTRVLGATSMVASAAAMATLLIGPFWASEVSGRVTEQDVPGFSVAVALLVAIALRRRRFVVLSVLAGLAGGGVLMTHTYEIMLVATLGVAAALTFPGRPRARPALAAVGVIVVTALATILPFVSGMLGADSARLTVKPVYLGHLGQSLYFWLLDPRRYVMFGDPAPGADIRLSHLAVVGLVVTVPCLLASLLCIVIAELRWARPWLAVWAFWTLVGIYTTTSGSGVAAFLNGLWYGNPDRLRVMIFPVYGVLTVAGGCALAIVARAAVARTRQAHPGRPAPIWTSAVGAVAPLLVLLLLTAVPATSRQLRQDLSVQAPKGDAYARAFTWLAAHTTKNDDIGYNRNLEFITWAYADYGVHPLIGLPPLVPQDAPHYYDRYLAWHWLTGEKVKAPQGCMVRRYHVKYVVVGTARIAGNWGVTYNRKRLAASPNVDLVHQDGGIKIYQVNARGGACAASA